MTRDYQKRNAKEYNLFRTFFQWLTCNMVYGLYYKIAFGLKIEGRCNIPKKGFCIVASNHVSAIDPFLVACAVNRPVAFMAKVELFEKKIMRLFLDLLGAFAVNRQKLSPSTIKTAHSIKQTNWLLGIFPQGTRERDDNMDNINKGFASFAKTLKCDIIPVGISGASKEKRKLFRSNITIKIGEPIKYTQNVEEMISLWSKKVMELIEGKKNESEKY
ncbi:MAG: 1-acyl-sn-glycerol-3-phosphate acyltransferase [Candidatus Gastranaerophilales bacterium]|nr:1-acyl-sn-glycerol-3-phosphate acyltransferase [Candidatus Gastranaerophilales bacterium]